MLVSFGNVHLFHNKFMTSIEKGLEKMDVPQQWNVCKRRLLMDSPLFDEGNLICYFTSKHFLMVNEEDEAIASEGNPEFLCQLANCGKVFYSNASYECHYGLIHSRVCQICRKNFPTNHLLDLHILESHDTMFALQVQKQPMFQCLVESCNSKFSTKKERKNHVVKVHKYPSNYRFDQAQDKHPHRKKGNQPVEMEVKLSGEEQNSSEAKCRATGTEGVNTMVETNGSSSPRRHFSYKVPNIICFGQGTSKGFQRSKGRGQGRCYKKRQHWHNKHQEDMDTHVNIEDVDLQGLKQALT